MQEHRRFVEEFANPYSWLMMADNLHEQAIEIYERRQASSFITQVDANGSILKQTRSIDKSAFLLGGFAIENALKAFLVYENPSWVSNGKLSGKLRTHSLTSLHDLSKNVPNKQSYKRVLADFESGLDSWFRYPCAISVEATKSEKPLSDRLWKNYRNLMLSYGRKLTGLLNSGWNGPHAFYGRWPINGPVLGFNASFQI